jgi:hypothetical protein
MMCSAASALLIAMNLLTPFLALLALPLAGALAQEYEIRLHRPMKAGEEYEVSETVRQSDTSVVTRMGTPVSRQNRDFTLTYRAVEKVLEVDALGQARRMLSTIGQLVKDENGSRTNVLAKGTAVVASLNGMKQVYEVNGRTLNAELGLLLDPLIVIPKISDTEDAFFGTDERKHVGDRWDIHTDTTTRALSQILGTPVSDVQGTVTLGDTAKSDEGDLLVVQVHLSGSTRLAVPGVAMDQSTFVYDINSLLPVDPTGADRGGQTTFTATFSAHSDVPGVGRLFSKGQSIQSAKRETRRLAERRPLGVPQNSTL